MSIETRTILKTYFETGNIPTQEQFYNLIDSYVHRIDDGVTVYPVPGLTQKRFGIGVLAPANRLGVRAAGEREALISLHADADTETHEWSFTLKPGEADNRGLAFEQQTASGPNNRMFIQGTTGHVGIGTILPTDILHIEKSTSDGTTGLKILNPATAANNGWKLGHLQNAFPERDGAFSVIESSASVGNVERMIVRPGGNVGINTPEPDTLLHVTKSPASADADLDLVEGTGIMVLGPMTDNLVADYRGIQARQGEYLGDVLDITPATLNLQRVGGDILIHGDETFDDSIKGIITAEGRLGLGTLTPIEKIEIDGAIKIGTTDNTIDNNGSIRFTGTDFEGRIGDEWTSLTAGNGPWAIGTGNGIYYKKGTAPRVSVGMIATDHTFTAYGKESVTAGFTAAKVMNLTSTSSTSPADNRIGLDVICTGSWLGDPGSKNVGIYVSEVKGQLTAETNIAAAFNGNTVLGDLPDDLNVIGTGGTRVLAIQPGISPSAAPESPAVQMYSQVTPDGFLALHVMTGEGAIVKLYQQPALIPATGSTLPTSYADAQPILENLLIRFAALEARLTRLGFLAAP